MRYSNEVAAYARFVDGKWEPITTTYTVVEKTVSIGGNNPMPRYLYAALVTDLGLYMREQTMEILWKKFPYATYCQEAARIGRDLS